MSAPRRDRGREVIVDAHSHLYPRSYIDLLKDRSSVPRVVGAGPGSERFVIFQSEDAPGGTGGRPFGFEFWDTDAKLTFMDRFRIDRSVVSLGNPWLDPFEGALARTAATTLNEGLAALEATTGGRIVCLGVVPQHDVAEAADVVREIAETEGLYGVANGSRLCGRMLDEPDLDPVWEALAVTGMPFVVHPHYSLRAQELSGYGMTPLVALGFPFE
ncbi:MAG: amidohydrolase family protein, partial [Dehalococcoidia bacterium]